MPTPANLHWKYFVDYFDQENHEFPAVYRKGKSKEIKEITRFRSLKEKNDALMLTKPDWYKKEVWDALQVGNQRFSLTTTYPGLLIGSGYRHETNSKDELKLGFSFDYTTGLPILPGSSVKGLLRSTFPGDPDKNQLYQRAEAFIGYLLQTKLGLSVEQSNAVDIPALETKLFGPTQGKERSKDEPLWEADIFYDALIGIDELGAVYAGKFFGNDFITPHRNRANPRMSPFTEPTPIQFLKVMPNVPVTFQFDLRGTKAGLDPKQRETLFRAIISELGIGAKTRVGYGQLTES